MKKEIESYRCGHCGNDLYKIYKETDENKEFIIVTECTKCGVKSSITCTKPRLSVDWTENEDRGCMSNF